MTDLPKLWTEEQEALHYRCSPPAYDWNDLTETTPPLVVVTDDAMPDVTVPTIQTLDDFRFSRYLRNETPIDFQAAEELVRQLDGNLASKCDSVFFYDAEEGYWKLQSDVDVQSAALAVLRRAYETYKKLGDQYKWGSANEVRSTHKQILLQTSQGPLRKQAPVQVVVFKNGTYDCKARRLVPHRREYGATYRVEADYLGAEAKCPPKFLRVVKTCYPEGALTVIRALIRWVVDPTSPYRRYWHIIGDSGTGKGILLSFCQSLLPSNLQSAMRHPADLTDGDKLYQLVFGRRLVVCADMPTQYQKGDVSIFLESVENKPQSARALFSKKNEDPQPMYAKFILASTAEMEFRGGDGSSGHLRRSLFLRTNPKAPDAEDITLDTDINGDTKQHELIRSQVVSWALAMPDEEFLAVLSDNDPAHLLRDNKLAAKSRTDAVSCWSDECLVPSSDPHAEVPQSELDEMFRCYRAWCTETNVRNTLAQATWLGALRKTLGSKRRVPRWKAPADANGNREWKPEYLAGFQLRSGVWSGGDFAYHHHARRVGGLAALAEQEQALRNPQQGA